MISDHNQRLAERAQGIYSERLQAELEATHLDRFVAVEPESGDHYIADTFAGAVSQARNSHPDRIAYVIHIGHHAALHLGGMSA